MSHAFRWKFQINSANQGREREREMFILSDFHSSIWVRSTSHLKTEWKLHGQYWSSSCSTRNSSPSSIISYLIQRFIFSATDLQYLLFLDQICQSESRSYAFRNVLSAPTFVQKLYCIYCTWKAFPQWALSCGSADGQKKCKCSCAFLG